MRKIVNWVAFIPHVLSFTKTVRFDLTVETDDSNFRRRNSLGYLIDL